MPRIRVEDIDDLDNLDFPSKERIKRQPKEERLVHVDKKRLKKSRHNSEVARRKEYVEDDSM